MKLAILLSLVALGACGVLNSRTNDDVAEIIRRYGYPFESYDVTTSDGYILQMFRINGGKSLTQRRSQSNYDRSSEESSFEESSLNSINLKSGQTRRPVLLMHGLLSNSVDFVVGGPSQGLAFFLADQGYDVYLGNARGTVYGQRHSTLNPKKDAAFWKFSWNEIGMKDLPAIVDKVLSVSKQSKISYVGHMEGTTSFYVLASERTEYNDKFDRMISLGPVAFMKNSENAVINKIFNHRSDKSWLIKHLGISTFVPSNDFIEEISNKCVDETFPERICKNNYFLLNGYNSQNLNETTGYNLITRVPSTSAVREVLHYVQLKSSGRFEKYDSDFNGQVDEYDLSKISTPVAILYTPQDQFSNVKDVEQLIQKLHHVMGPVKFEQLSNNMDLIFSRNVADSVYQVVAKMLKEDPQTMIARKQTL